MTSRKRKNWNYLLILFASLLQLQAVAQKFTLSGYIKDSSSGEDLIGATVAFPELTTGTTANVYGFYSITLPAGTYKVEYTYIGYQKITETIVLDKDITKNVELALNSESLKEVVVSSEREDKNVKDVQMSVEKISMETIQKIPQLLGEADVVKSIQLRPGVTTVGEGATGFNVRGGNIDQNLILLDDAPIFNSSHLFGFFSTFNPDAIKSAELYKGGIPARYGGRLSSVFDVRQRDGNLKEFHGQGGVGVLFSRLTLEGPIAKDKASFLISGRRSYADLFLRLNPDFADVAAYFYDLNAKINYKINDNNRVYLSTYFGRDIFGFGNDFQTAWGNSSVSARWNHLFSEKLFSNVTVFYSNYGYSLGAPEGTQAFNWSSTIENVNAKMDFTHYVNPSNTLEYGFNLLYYNFEPGRIEGSDENSFFNELEVPHEHAFEPAVYISNEQTIGLFTLKYGIRYSHFFNVGASEINLYRYGQPTTEEDIIGTETYDSYENIADYGGFEPRIAINYLLNDVSSLKASYMRTRQYLHLVSNTTSATPVDVWKPAGKYVEPATSDQYALGYFRNLKANTYEFSAEAYYKDMRNLLDYKDGAELLLNENVETEFLTGNGRAYGLELMLEKKKGKFTGWISYTLSRSEMKVEGYSVGDYTEVEDGINQGDWYPSNWDKTHDLTIVGSYTFNEKWDLSGTFSFMTGRPITYPTGYYYYDGKIVPNYRYRNQDRVPTFHRLDLSATYHFPDKGKRFRSSLAFGVYNVYGRRNPYSISVRQEQYHAYQAEAVQLSIIGIPVPSITWNFKF